MSKRLKAGVCYHGPQWKVNRIEPCSVTGGVLLFIFFSWGVVGIKKGVYLWGQTNTHTMKNEILKAIGSRLMEDARVYMDGPERPFNPTNDNHPSSFLAVCDAMEDIDKLLGWA